MNTLEAIPTAAAPPTLPPLRIATPTARTPLQALRRYATLGFRLLWRRAGERARALRAGWLRLRAGPRLRAAERLCLGSGNAPIPGWTNVDLDGTPDVRLDLARRLPLRNGQLARIYSEHLIEHLSCEAGLALLCECRRVLRDDGVLRIATPDLARLVERYRHDWRDQDWLRWPGHEWIDTPARMLNQAMRGWGHEHLYDAAELEHRLRQAGFADVRRCELGASEHQDLAGLETRRDSSLILEARGRLETTP
ncbi:MAG: hypothetical protein KDE27_19225 [Planctomycetes bacterium]|nr:hypothetical protein [Planctomycetota bacterium]